MSTVLYDSKINFRAYKFQLSCLIGLSVLTAGIGLLYAVPKMVKLFFEFKGTRYGITTERITVRTGFFSKRVDTLDLWRVRDLQYVQSFGDRLFGSSSITLVTQDVSDVLIQLKGFTSEEGLQLFTELTKAVSKDRSQKAVTITA